MNEFSDHLTPSLGIQFLGNVILPFEDDKLMDDAGVTSLNTSVIIQLLFAFPQAVRFVQEVGAAPEETN